MMHERKLIFLFIERRSVQTHRQHFLSHAEMQEEIQREYVKRFRSERVYRRKY